MPLAVGVVHLGHHAGQRSVGAVAPVHRQRVERRRPEHARALASMSTRPHVSRRPCSPGERVDVLPDRRGRVTEVVGRRRTGLGAQPARQQPALDSRPRDVVEVDQPQVAAGTRTRWRSGAVRVCAIADVVERGRRPPASSEPSPSGPERRGRAHAGRRSRPRGSPSRGTRRRRRSGRRSARAADAARPPTPGCRPGARRPSGASTASGSTRSVGVQGDQVVDRLVEPLQPVHVVADLHVVGSRRRRRSIR